MGGNEVIAHNVNFYTPKPRAIHCMALNRWNMKLAVSRSDNSIEIWDVANIPQIQKIIPSQGVNTVEDIKWHQKRLFSCGLQGSILELDTFTESILYSKSVIGGPTWCLDINSKCSLLACGTEDGCINIFHITPDGLEHYKFMDKQQGRILCICWEKNGQHLITGSTDVVRVWNVEKGHAVHKMTTGRSHNQKETIVWTLSVTSDFTIISGDSRGFLCFWDGKLGTLIEDFHSHEKDIFSVVLSEDELKVYCAGIDPVVAIYGKVCESTGSRRKWAKGGIRRIHNWDVRALALSQDGKLYSGGVDGYLIVSSFAPKILMKFPPVLKGPCVKLSAGKRYIMLRYQTHLEIWQLSNISTYQGVSEAAFKRSGNQTQLLNLKAKEGDMIISSSISANGEFIAYSTDSAIRFFKLSFDRNSSITKLPGPTDCGPCRLIEFYQIKKRQFCAVVTKKNEISILEVGESGPDIVHTIKPNENETLTDTISHLVVTSDNAFLIAADYNSNIAIWSRLNWSYLCNIPTRKSAITSIGVSNKNLVVVAYSDFKLIEFNICEKRRTALMKSNGKQEIQMHSPLVDLAIDPKTYSVVAHNDTCICVITKEETRVSEAKVAKLGNCTRNDEGLQEIEVNFRFIKKSKHLIYMGWLRDDEVVVVTVSPLKIAENYPAAYNKKRYIA